MGANACSTATKLYNSGMTFLHKLNLDALVNQVMRSYGWCFVKQQLHIWQHKYNLCTTPIPYSNLRPGVGVTKAPLVNYSVIKIFDLTNVPVMFIESHSYLTVVTAAELRRHLSNINVIFKIWCIYFDNGDKLGALRSGGNCLSNPHHRARCSE